jgi:hypothetical protein
MTAGNQLAMAMTAASSFLYVMHVGDSLGATAFSDNAWIAYPPSSQSVAVIRSKSDQDTANRAVMALRAQNMTNMTAGLATSAGMLSTAVSPKAIVMLSDGIYNNGGDPRNSLPTMPVYTIALGNNGQVQVLQDIARRTNAKFYLSPTPFELRSMYNDIVGQTQVASVLANANQMVSQNNFWILPGTVAAGVNEATFSIGWTDWSVTYTSGTPVGNQVNVTLQDPSGTTLSPTPLAVGNGFVVFKIENPLAGQWQVAIWSAANQTLGTNGAMFDLQLSAQLEVEAPMNGIVGTPVAVKAQVRDLDGSLVRAVRISASVEMPSMDPDDAVKKHRTKLDALAPPEVPEEASDNVRMLTLQMQLGPNERLLPYYHIPLRSEQRADGARHLEFIPRNKGGHTVHLTATGHAPAAQRDFSLSRLASVWVDRS